MQQEFNVVEKADVASVRRYLLNENAEMRRPGFQVQCSRKQGQSPIFHPLGRRQLYILPRAIITRVFKNILWSTQFTPVNIKYWT